MRRPSPPPLLALAVLALALPPARSARADGFDERTLRELTSALACANLSVDDLSWDKRPIDDPFRLTVVNRAMDHPLELATLADEAARDFGEEPGKAALMARRWLERVSPAKLPLVQSSSRSLSYRDPGVRERARFAATAPAPLRDLVRGARAASAAITDEATFDTPQLRRDAARLYLDESEESWDSTAIRKQAEDRFDLDSMLDALAELAELARAVRTWSVPGSVETRTWLVDGGTVALGGPGNDHHTARIVLDVGGDDVYDGCQFVVDLAGNDTYHDVASGLFDAGLIVDLHGNDTYLSKNVGQGGALGGASLLLDVEGDDRYEADQVSQGAAVLGIGMLFDLSGNDSYRGARFVQGFGGMLGLGVLSDRAGADTYWAGGKYSHAPLLPENWQSLSQGFGFGLRPDASGGVGILLDTAGNDSYHAEVFGQGCSYWFALGLLVDSAGHDKYDLFQYGQGAGIHLSAAALVDGGGRDAYSCNNGVAQGSGHDWGVGLVWDRGGEDYYQGAGMSQGGANANGFGMLVDEGGNDGYSGTREKNQGDSFFTRGTFGLGVLLDLGGADRYSHGGHDGLTWTRGTVGVGRDVAEETAP